MSAQPGVLERIATALEAIAAGGGSITPAAAGGGTAEPAAPPKPAGPTRDDVRAALKEYAKINGRDEAIKVLSDHGADSIAKLAEDKFAAVIALLAKDD